MRLLTKLILVGMLLASPISAIAHFEDGYDLYQKWLEYKKCRAGLPCLAYNDGFYKAYVLGMADAYGALFISVPEDISVGTVCGIVGQYMEEHQDELDRSASLIVFNALSRAFPKKQAEIRYQCPKKSRSDYCATRMSAACHAFQRLTGARRRPVPNRTSWSQGSPIQQVRNIRQT